MAQQYRRPLAEPPQPIPGSSEPARRGPLARAAIAVPPHQQPAPLHPGAGRARGQTRQAAAPEREGAPGEELRLDPATIVLSLPVAVSLGQMLIDQSLDALPQAVLWAGGLAVWKAATAPGVGRGALDWLVDASNLGPELRQRLGVPARLPRAAPRPGTHGAWGLIDGLAADVRTLQAAIRVRRGEVVGEPAPAAATGRTVRLGAGPDDDVDIAAVEALDDAGGNDVPGIGLPVVTLEQIANLDNLWVVGPKNSGKTTLLRQLIALRRGKHYTLDPHATPGKWPGCTVLGGGLAFDAIDRQLHQFLAWMRQRYQAQARGTVSEAQCKAARRTMVGDEWRAIRKALPEIRATRETPAIPSAADRLLDILSQGRKAGICALVASHADTAESMGVTGEKDILRCFDLIIYLGALATERVPAAAQMARPAVVYDPERSSWAQLLITVGGVQADVAPPANAGTLVAPEPHVPASTSRVAPVGEDTSLYRSPAMAPAADPAPADPLLTELFHVTPATPARGDRATRLAAILARQATTDAAPAGSMPPVTRATRSSNIAAEEQPPRPEATRSEREPAPDGQPDRSRSLRPHVPTNDQGQRDSSRSDVIVLPRDGGELHLHVHASAEAHAPATDRPGEPWRRKGPVVNSRDRRRRALYGRPSNRADELHRAYREAGAAGRAYRAVYRELGGSKDTTLAAWRGGRDGRTEQRPA